MGRNSANQTKRQTTNASRKRYPKKQKNLLDREKCFKEKFRERIHRSKQSISESVNDTTNFTYCFKNEEIENEHVCSSFHSKQEYSPHFD